MSENIISTIIDKHLKIWINKELNTLPDVTEPEMANPNNAMDEEGWQKWFPINSTVTNEEIEQIETQLNFKLPKSYIIFLKHKHFYELYISEARFSGQEIRNWKNNLIEMAFNGYPQEFLIDKGYIPFADWSDWGLLCFNANKPIINNEYSIVIWDHERCDEFVDFSENFERLLTKLDKLSDKNKS